MNILSCISYHLLIEKASQTYFFANFDHLFYLAPLIYAMNKLVLLFTIFISSIQILGQSLNFTQYLPPRARNINAVQMLTNGNIAVFGGNPSNDSITHISLTKDGGDNWTTSVDKPREPMIFGVTYKSLNVGFAVGDRNGIWKTTDGGENWTSIAAPSSLNVRQFKSIEFINNDTGFIVGGSVSNDSIQTLLKTTDGGANWSIQFDRLGPQFNDIEMSGSNGLIVGNDGTVLHSTDRGNTWHKPILGKINIRDYTSVSFGAGNSAIIVGGNLRNDSIQTILKSTNGGHMWSVIKDSPSPMLNDIDFMFDGISAIAVGNNGTAMKTDDTGKTWTPITLANVTDAWTFNCVQFLNADNALIGGQSGALFVAQNKQSLSNNQLKRAQVKVYPNPTYGNFRIDENIKSVKAYNSLGKEVLVYRNGNNYELGHLQNGIYIIKITDQNNYTSTQNLVLLK